jgi:dimethylamine corrinoid protein
LDLEKIKQAVVEMDDGAVKTLIETALKEKIPAQEILQNGLIAGMKEVGRLFSCQEYFVPEVLSASEAFYIGFNIISPLIKPQQGKSKLKVVMCVVEGDIHDIGKNIVKVMIEAAGCEVIDLGRNVAIKRIIDAVEKEKPNVLAMSSLMTTTMMSMTDVIKELDKRGLRKNLKIIVGGAPLNQEFCDQIGADGYGRDAAEAVQLIEKFL